VIKVRFCEWQKGLIDGRMDEAGTPSVGARCLTTRRIGFANRPIRRACPYRFEDTA
jgi:hypothetical protein